ncbi:HpcH/HpaI aldolase/citrate lyase family protein [Nonomuraea sp. NPDC050153]|uniref:HpcH/HpaI aldolase/citrate lyase family protein n=1 Tax=Nonomuraea sp. NPDC050153 TaxID=3364359 RepID=UPI0037A6CDAD
MPGLRSLIRERPAIGTFLKLPQPEVVEVLAIAGLDFLICDTEHAQIDESGARTVIQAGRAAGIPIVVRVPTIDSGQINRLLEAGAAGIQLSSTTSADRAGKLSGFTTYPPAGLRGLSTAQSSARFGTIPLADYLALSNDQVLRVGQLESARYDDPLDDIMSSLDIAFIGTMDLSVDLGVPGQVGASVVQAKIGEIEAAARRAGTPLGIFAATAAEAERAVAAGYRYIAVASDLALLTTAAEERFTVLMEAVGGARG